MLAWFIGLTLATSIFAWVMVIANSEYDEDKGRRVWTWEK